MIFDDKVVLITGGTGSFGKEMVQTILKKHKPKKVIIFSRDELKQFEMQRTLGHSSLRFFLGDVRDRDRLYRAFHGVDIVIHAAALKQVPAAEYNPFETIKTNIMGAANVIDAAIDQNVKKVIALSSDKAANPINLYGATKLCADKLFIAGNAYAHNSQSLFSVVRYGNVVGSRGSVVHVFKEKERDGIIPITDDRMTRFWITLPQAVHFVTERLEDMVGGEIFIPRIPSIKIVDLAKAIAPNCQLKKIGIRPGEKLDELMFGREDAPRTISIKDYYVIKPLFGTDLAENYYAKGKTVPEDYIYSSDQNTEWLGVEAIRAQLKELKFI